MTTDPQSIVLEWSGRNEFVLTDSTNDQNKHL